MTPKFLWSVLPLLESAAMFVVDRSRGRKLCSVLLCGAGLAAFFWGLPAIADKSEKSERADKEKEKTSAPLRCVEQKAQSFLIRSHWFQRTTEEEAKAGAAMQEQALRYRTETYGYFSGFGKSEWNPHSPGESATNTAFMGLPVTVHKRIVPALQCVEKALRDGPAHLAYQPRALGGIRYHNTYRGGEVSNHVYGIAIDIDPDLNTCCGCVGHWSQHPLCKKKVKSVFERMQMPNSWVQSFERYGFYWLGHDPMQDTMHFEFLGTPQ